MIKYIFIAIVGFALGLSIEVAFSKTETSTTDARSIVMYGNNSGTIVPLLVNADGVVQIH